VSADRACVQEHAIIDVANVGGSNRSVAGDEGSFAEVGGNVVVLGEVVESAARQDRELDTSLRDEGRGGGNRTISARDENSLCPAIDRLLKTALKLGRLNRLEL